jgi:hypothetical protein
LLALLQKRRTLETDAEIIEAIGDCERASR